MAAPNIAQLNNIYGNTATYLANTIAGAFLTNGTNSGSVIKVNSVVIANYLPTTANAYVDILRGGISYPILGFAQVPPNSTMVAIGRDVVMYLVEGDSLRANSNVASGISITSSYETIS
jgi:hypothetical protein